MTKLIHRNNISQKQNLGYIKTKDTKGNDVFVYVNMTYSDRVFLVDIYEILEYIKDEDEVGPIYIATDIKHIWQSRGLGSYNIEEDSKVTLSKATIIKCLKVMFDDIYEFGYNKTINQQIKDLVNERNQNRILH